MTKFEIGKTYYSGEVFIELNDSFIYELNVTDIKDNMLFYDLTYYDINNYNKHLIKGNTQTNLIAHIDSTDYYQYITIKTLRKIRIAATTTNHGYIKEN